MHQQNAWGPLPKFSRCYMPWDHQGQPQQWHCCTMTIHLHSEVLAVSRRAPDCVLHSAIADLWPPPPSPSRKSLAFLQASVHILALLISDFQWAPCLPYRAGWWHEKFSAQRMVLSGAWEFWLGFPCCCQTVHPCFLLLGHAYLSTLVFFLLWVRRLMGTQHKVRGKRPRERNSSRACL